MVKKKKKGPKLIPKPESPSRGRLSSAEDLFDGFTTSINLLIMMSPQLIERIKLQIFLLKHQSILQYIPRITILQLGGLFLFLLQRMIQQLLTLMAMINLA